MRARKQAADEIGMAEVQRMTGRSRKAVINLVLSGLLPARQVGGQRRYRVLRGDVQRLIKEKKLLKTARRKIRLVWVRHFGEIPKRMTVVPIDGNDANLSPRNLKLVPLAKHKDGTEQFRHITRRWTADEIAILRRDFETVKSATIGLALKRTRQQVQLKARRLGLRKKFNYHQGKPKSPIGTEKVTRDGTRDGTVMVKVTDTKWRRKHHVEWEKANGRPLPDGYGVAFKDGNYRNFAPDNLVLVTRGEQRVLGRMKHAARSFEQRQVIKLAGKLERDALRQLGALPVPTDRKPKSPRRTDKSRRWTAEMDEVVIRDYPNKPTSGICAELGVTHSVLRQRATKLRVNRTPEAIFASAAQERAA